VQFNLNRIVMRCQHKLDSLFEEDRVLFPTEAHLETARQQAFTNPLIAGNTRGSVNIEAIQTTVHHPGHLLSSFSDRTSFLQALLPLTHSSTVADLAPESPSPSSKPSAQVFRTDPTLHIQQLRR
jgi:hypothetical protein